jgi:hypothetical protein
MSRVTSLDGLYLTNTRDDHKFYHGYGGTAPTVKEIKDEYAHMNKHGLPTLAKRASHFCWRVSSSEVTEIAPDVRSLHLRDREYDTDNPRQLILIVTTISANAVDLISDTVLVASDCLAISETWMDDSRPVQLHGFKIKTCRNTAIQRSSNQPSTSSDRPTRVSAAGGVALYRNVDSVTECRLDHAIELQLRARTVGDVCLLDICIGCSISASECPELKPSCSSPTASRKSFPITSLTQTFRSS